MVVCFYNEAPEYYLRQKIGSTSTPERMVAFVADLERRLGEPVAVTLYTSEEFADVPSSWNVEHGARLTEAGLIEALARSVQRAKDESAPDILFAHFDEPFLSSDLATRLLERHRTYRAQYTFSDGYPRGLSPEIVSASVVSQFGTLARAADPVTRQGLFPIVQRDINRLDVETELSSVDQRLMRLDLAVDSRANLSICQSLADGAPETIDEWPAHAEQTREAHRSLPRFVSVQVLEQEVQCLSYSPYPQMRAHATEPGAVMSAADFGSIVTQLNEFAPEAVVHLSLWGEIALHPTLKELTRAVLETDRLGLLVETSGVGWRPQARADLFSIDSDRFNLIVGLDTNDPELYQHVRGEGFDEAQEFARTAIESLGIRCHVQAVRSALTEPQLDAFYRSWKERTPNVIVQKYDHFAGRLPGLKIGDISPLVRFPCWHLQRDLSIRVDGSIALCREDLDGAIALGNALQGGLVRAWVEGCSHYAHHVSGTSPGICEGCDEYYTFNF